MFVLVEFGTLPAGGFEYGAPPKEQSVFGEVSVPRRHPAAQDCE